MRVFVCHIQPASGMAAAWGHCRSHLGRFALKPTVLTAAQLWEPPKSALGAPKICSGHRIPHLAGLGETSQSISSSLGANTQNTSQTAGCAWVWNTPGMGMHPGQPLPTLNHPVVKEFSQFPP